MLLIPAHRLFVLFYRPEDDGSIRRKIRGECSVIHKHSTPRKIREQVGDPTGEVPEHPIGTDRTSDVAIWMVLGSVVVHAFQQGVALHHLRGWWQGCTSNRAIRIGPTRPDGLGIDVIMRIYLPDLKKTKTGKAPKAEIVK